MRITAARFEPAASIAVGRKKGETSKYGVSPLLYNL